MDKPIDEFNGCHRGFYRFSRSYYAKNVPLQPNIADKVQFGYYDLLEGGTEGEMKMEWVQLGKSQPTPHLCVFDDAWVTLNRFSDVVEALGRVSERNIQPDEFSQLLLSLGFKDLTQTEDPDSKDDTPNECFTALKEIETSIQSALGLAGEVDALETRKHLWKALEKVRQARDALPKEATPGG